MSEYKLYQILEDSVNHIIDDQAHEGQVPSGHNGPWGNPQTPVRNTSHHTITLIHLAEQTADQRYGKKANECLSYLLSKEARPYDQTFYHLKEHEKSRCNGLIGQAWTIEALVLAAKYFDRPNLIDLAQEVFLLHSFDDQLAAWDYVDVDGQFQSLDKTFNHQLWFAMAGAMLAHCPDTEPKIKHQVHSFLDELPENLNLYDSGLIYHPFKPEFDIIKYSKIFAEGIQSGVAHKMISNVMQATIGGESGDPMKETSIGYHSFNLYAFGVLNEYFPDHQFWESKKFKRSLEYAQSDQFKNQLAGNPYGYPYNCAGIEMAYVLNTFSEDSIEMQRQWLKEQFERTFDPETMRMSRNNPDPATLTARLYEATRLPNIELSLSFEQENEI
ncbi:glycoside hydrolase family 88 protein [Natronorubrum texcoconense]|uniref:Agl cluster protein AglQ n=1 Tax=Natronorubrum texcoconense TaxID=1095776 RepID=A0A1G8VQK1_9EURY|nr:agl cluster protein AglQ [Natronorubrum texcoconense]SDJ68254.1 hypothetical protein SAMN04515672_1454 [Natronorubrum texcoconense]